MAVVTMRDFTPFGYSFESTWGTDPATARLPFLGDIKKAVVSGPDWQKEARRSIGSGIDPKGFARKWKKVGFNLEMNLADDNPSNSLLGLALGSAPNGTTGLITNYPTTSYGNLRSITIEGGFDWPDTDEFWLLTGCMIESLDLTLEDGLAKEEIKFSVKDCVRSSSRAVAAPTESTTSLFNPNDDATVTWNTSPVPTVYGEKLKFSIQNKLKSKAVVGPTPTLGYCEIVGRDVFLEATIPRVDDVFLDKYEADPSSADAELTSIILNLAKNSNSEYINITLNNPQVLGPYELNIEDSDAEVMDSWKFQAKTYSVDVKA